MCELKASEHKINILDIEEESEKDSKNILIESEDITK